MNYVQIVTRALAISWRHKYLWLLALLAGEATTISTSFQTGSSRSSHGTLPTGGGWPQLSSWAAGHVSLLVTAGVVLAVLGVALFLLSAVANGALVRGGAEHDAERPFGFRQAWSAGLRSFRPVLGIKAFAVVVFVTIGILISGLALMTVFFATTGALVAAAATGLLAAVLLVAAIPFVLVFGVTIVLAVRAAVLEGAGASDSFQTAIRMIWRRPGRVALFWLVVCIAGALASIAAGLALVVAAVPIVALTIAAYVAGGWVFAAATGSVFGAAWLIVVLTFVGGVKAFTSTCWTLAYTRFDLEPQPAVSGLPQPA